MTYVCRRGKCGQMKKEYMLTYRGFHITYDPPPIPLRNSDWQYWHDDYDGADDANDDRHGSAKSLNDCRDEIDTYWRENKMDDYSNCQKCGAPTKDGVYLNTVLFEEMQNGTIS